ncbi:MAG: protein kinase [Kiritimatiellae bacterium]|nr:protein kinase [Kiritimatiellia bacterium]
MTSDTINDALTAAPNAEGTLLAGRYRIVRQLGQGGMGSVWLAEDTQLDDKPFAIKMLPSILVANKRAYRQLKDEALVAMRLVHPNIVQIRAFEENDGNPFLVMDYVDGQTLDDYLAEHALGEAASRRFNSAPLGEAASRRFTGTTGVPPVAHGLPEADVLRILRPIAAALDYAHAKGVVHRDVKPGNVMIAKDGTPYILDFGIAREIQETLTRVTGKLSSGTLLYMSPEQLNGAQPKPAQDVYSFAAMVYECLKGEPPFSHGQIEFQIMNKQPEPPPGGTQLVASVMSGLAKNSEDRPPTCSAVLEGDGFSHKERKDAGAVARVATETGRSRVSRPPDSQPGRVASPRRPQGGVWKILLAVFVLGLVVTGVWGLRRGMNGEARGEEEGEHTVFASGHKGIQLWENGPYWAETNIGAEKPWECGYYFWWGDTVGYKRENDAWVASDGSSLNYSFEDKATPTDDKATSTLKRNGWITGDNVLSPEHDAAHVHWGGAWRMPTDLELDDLCKKCDWIWTTTNSANGYVVRGRSSYASASIFLPAVGESDGGTSLFRAGYAGYYWSSVPRSGSSHSWYLYFYDSNDHGKDGFGSRYDGYAVRPVQGFTK